MAKAIHEKYRAQMTGEECNPGMLVVSIVSILGAAVSFVLGLTYAVGLCCNNPQPGWFLWSIPVMLASIIIFIWSSRALDRESWG